MAERHSIKHYTSKPGSKSKAWLCERTHRTVRTLLGRLKFIRKQANLVELLAECERILNEVMKNPHLGKSPLETRNEDGPSVLASIKRRRGKLMTKLPPDTKAKFSVGDSVLVRDPKQIGPFAKGDAAKFLTDVYEVASVVPSEPRERYRLKQSGRSMYGSFPPSQLSAIDASPALPPFQQTVVPRASTLYMTRSHAKLLSKNGTKARP